jgi:hypothetical protein
MNQYNLNVTISANTKEEAEEKLQDLMQRAASFPELLTISLLLKYANDMMAQDLKDGHRFALMQQNLNRKTRKEQTGQEAVID